MSDSESWASSPLRRRIMQSNRARDTAPEIAVRRLLHARGLRFRVDMRPVPDLRRRADVVFTRKRIAIFIDGCYWHGCPDHGTTRFHTNSEFWLQKIARNRVRDADTDRRLAEAGWRVLRFWEHEDPERVAAAIDAEARLASDR